MKKLYSTVLASALVLGGIHAAAGQTTGINDFYAMDGVVYVETVNTAETEKVFTLSMIKNDDDLTMRKKLYAVQQKIAQPGEEIIFDIPVPDERLGVRGSGEYTLSLSDESGNRDEEVFDYEDSAGKKEFVDSVKAAAKTVTDSEKADEVLMPLFESKQGLGAIFGMNIDIREYITSPEAVKKDVLNIFYNSGTEELTVETFPGAFSGAFGLATYNSGDAEKGVRILNVKYNGEPIEDKYISSLVKNMDKTYDTVDEFESDFKLIYGLNNIANAKVDELKDVISVFADEVGECTDIIDKIESLSSLKRYTAYEYIAEIPEAEFKSADDLEKILEAAHKKASSDNQGASGIGGGGGAAGSVSNRAPNTGGAVSSVMGSGTPDVRPEIATEYIFSDISAEHWAAEAVRELRARGIVNGTETGAFEPERAVAREEFTKMLVAACGIETDGYSAEFDDTESGEWYAAHIGAAVDKGIVKGIGNNMFGIGALITRQDMAVMTARALETIGKEVTPSAEAVAFSDDSMIADYARDSVAKLCSSGIINGKPGNVFDPEGNATRAEAAKIIYEAFKGGI